jgi:hypothetical protein
LEFSRFEAKMTRQGLEEIVNNKSSSSTIDASTEKQSQLSLQRPWMEPDFDSAAAVVVPPKIPPIDNLQDTSDSSIVDAIAGSTVDEVTVDTTLTSSDYKTETEHKDQIDCTKEEQVDDNSEGHGPLAILRKGAVAAVGGTMVSVHQGPY